MLTNRESVDSELIVYSDAPKNKNALASVNAVREYLHSVSGFRSITIVERSENFGLVKNITSGITEVVNKYGRVIVLEDDHSVSPFFLKYMNEGLSRLEDREDIASIHGYMYPHKKPLPEVFLIKGADCWGWATWKRAWDVFDSNARSLYQEIIRQGRQQEFDFNGSYPYMQMLKDQAEGKAGSWAICWYASAFLKNMYTVYPNESMVQINSLRDGGEHGIPSPYMLLYTVKMKSGPIEWALGRLDQECVEGRNAFASFFISQKSRCRKGYVYVKELIMRMIEKWK